MSGGPWEDYKPRTSAPAAQDGPWTAYQPAQKPGIVEDIARAVPAGLAKGVAGVVGLPGVAKDMIVDPIASVPGRLYNLAFGDGTWQEPAGMAEARRAPSPLDALGPEAILNPKTIMGALTSVVPALNYEPQTVPGQYAGTIAEFAPGAAFGVGTKMQRAVQVVAPALASETAGQATKGSELEPYARLAAGLGTGVGVAVGQTPRGANAIAGRDLQAGGITARNVDDAGRLVADAAQKGITLSWDEALNQVTKGQARNLSETRSIVEQSSGPGAAAFERLNAQRPGEIAAAGAREIDALAPNPYPADVSAVKGAQAAQGALKEVRQERTAAVSPYYRAAEADVVPAQSVEAVIKQLDTIIAQDVTGEMSQAARQLRAQLIEKPATPGVPAVPAERVKEGAFYRTIPGTPEVPPTPAIPRTRVGELDNIYGAARDDFAGPLPLGATGTQARGQRLTTQALSALDEELQAASPSLAQGRQAYRDFTQSTVAPVENGPLGRIATVDPANQGATQTMGRALAGVGEGDRYAGIVQQSVRRMVRQDPRAAETLARDYIGDVFNTKIGDLKTGADQYGGAGFRAALIGDPASARNIQALVTQLPQGQQRWAGFNRFLDVMEATGYKPAKGSQTATRTEKIGDMRGAGGLVNATVEESLKLGTGLPKRLAERFQRYRKEANGQELAAILTSPKSGAILRQLANAPPDSSQAAALALRLTYIAERAVNGPAQRE